MGIGFPAWTGGTVQYMDQYEGGLTGFVKRADELCGLYGPEFTVPDSLRAKAAAGGSWSQGLTTTGTGRG
jgi:3-hydroxyacyl-CoA dehydrogenase/enoyl-CoA hydratase/3-hydroxybutyryl-CoA epimerase